MPGSKLTKSYPAWIYPDGGCPDGSCLGESWTRGGFSLITVKMKQTYNTSLWVHTNHCDLYINGDLNYIYIGIILTYIYIHWENYISNSFQIEWNMIVVTDFLSTLNQMEFHLAQNRKENCHHNHIPFNVKENGNIVFSV